MSDKIEFDVKEYLEAKFAEQTRLHEAHAATTAALFKSLENKVGGVGKRVGDLQWFIGILVAITLVAMAGVVLVSFNHAHAQEVTSRNCCETQRTNS